MVVNIPAELQEFVSNEVSLGHYDSSDELVRDALLLLQAFRLREKTLAGEVQVGVSQARQGLARTLDVDGLVSRMTEAMAAEGIHD